MNETTSTTLSRERPVQESLSAILDELMRNSCVSRVDVVGYTIFIVPHETAGTPDVETLVSAGAERLLAAHERRDVRTRLFRREGEYWSIGDERCTVRLRDGKGLRSIAHLLRHPGREFHVLDLVREIEPAPVPSCLGEATVIQLREAGLRSVPPGDAGPVLDARARAAYRFRLEELRADLQEAEQFNDRGREAKLRAEIDFVAEELRKSFGLGGRDRRAASLVEKVRVNVTKQIKSATRRIAAYDPPLSRHLATTIKTGAFCRYEPDPQTTVDWIF